MIPTSSVIAYEVDSYIAKITLNHADRKNPLNTITRAALLDAINAANSDPIVRAVILTGAGDVFCAGADLRDKRIDGYTLQEQIEQEYKPILMSIAQAPKLYIGALNGPAVGAGAGLALATDLLVMADSANLSIAFARIGLGPDMGISWWLTRHVGRKRALELIVAADRISAQECLELGLANKVVSRDSLMSETCAWAQKIVEGAPLAQRHTKMLVGNAYDLSLGDAISQEADLQQRIVNSEDAKEGIYAFLEKRKPEFKGS